MPSVKSKAAPATSPAPKKAGPKPKTAAERPLKYPEYQSVLYATGTDLGPITVELIKEWLGWETESEYAERVARETPGAKASKITFGNNYHFTDVLGNKIRCRNNGRNRPFDTDRSLALAQELLHRNWAGPTCFPGETVNGEAFVFSRTGECHNGQKRGAALVFAAQMYDRDEHWRELWPDGPPVMDSQVTFGVSDREEIVRTIDCAAERTEADMFYSMDIFAALDPKDRRECSKATQEAVDLLWARTGAKNQLWTKYKTNAEAKLFVDRHPTLMRCIKHCFEENKDRAFHNVRTKTGVAAGLMYLMAASAADGDSYRSAEPRVETGLDLSLFDKASDFWVTAAVASPVTENPFDPLFKAISKLIDDEAGADERIATLWKAWCAFRDKNQVTANDLELEYAKNAKGEFILKENGRKRLVEFADFGGIDVPVGDAETVTPSQAAETKINRRAIDTERLRAEASTNGTAGVAAKANLKRTEMLSKLRAKHPGKILLFKSATSGIYRAFNGDCQAVRGVLDVPIQDDEGQQFCTIPQNRLEHLIKRLIAAGKKVAVCEQVGEVTKVTDAPKK